MLYSDVFGRGDASEISGDSFFFFFSQNQMVKILPFLPDLLNQNARGGAGCLNFDNILPGTSIYSPGCEPCSKELGYL